MFFFSKIYYLARINRRKRKFLTVLSLTSGLTMLLMLHQNSIITPLEAELLKLPLPTNDTPVEYFIPDDGRGTEIPSTEQLQHQKPVIRYSLSKSVNIFRSGESRGRHVENSQEQQLVKAKKWQQKRLSRDDDVIRNDEEQTVEEDFTTENAPQCCKEDFHQNPYVNDENNEVKQNSKPKGDHTIASKNFIQNVDSNIKSVNIKKYLHKKKLNEGKKKAKMKDSSGMDRLGSKRQLRSNRYPSVSPRKVMQTNSYVSRKNNKTLTKSYSRKNNKTQTESYSLKNNKTQTESYRNKNYYREGHSDKASQTFDTDNQIHFPNRTVRDVANYQNPKHDTNEIASGVVDRKISGNTIININIENFVNNSPLKPFNSDLQLVNYTRHRKEKSAEQIRNRKSVSSFTYLNERFDDDKTNSDGNYNTNDNNLPIIIPEVTVSNVSFSALKKNSLQKIFDRIDIAKIMGNATYRNSILSRDLSQWSDFLVLPEENPENTYEPNNVIETFEWKTRKPGEAERKERASDWDRYQTRHKSFETVKISFSLRDLPRSKIRKKFSATQGFRLTNIGKHTKRSDYLGNVTSISDDSLGGGRQWSEFSVKEISPDYHNVLYPYNLDYTRPAYFPWRSTKDECANYATRFLVGGTGKIVPLASFPGSGNTWLRYISEVMAGIFSGSLYEDDILAIRGFWGERDSYIEGTTLLQKSHSLPALPEDVTEWDGRMILGPPPRKVVLLIRSPYEALVALRHFHAAGHTGFGHHSAFSGTSWDNFTEVRADSWLQLNKAWLELQDTAVLVIHYEMLMQNLENEIRRLMKFLGIPLDSGRLSCLSRYPEGKFRRPRYSKHLQGYQISRKCASTIATAITALDQILAQNGHPTLPTHLYSYHPPTKPP